MSRIPYPKAVFYEKKIIFEALQRELELTSIRQSVYVNHAIVEKLMFTEAFQEYLLKICENHIGKNFRYYDLQNAFKKINSINSTYQKAADEIVKTTYELMKYVK